MLQGLKVLDFSRLLPGPYATLVLADLGADVIKVEAPQGGDYLRWMPPLTSGAVSYAFSALNSGKRSLAVDLKKDAGRDAVASLASQVDIIVESFRPGVMARLGLGYEALRERNPGLIFCSISGFGQDGPYRSISGHDLNYAALGGAMGLAGPADAPPALPPIQMADYGGSLWALIAILSALHERQRTGLGRHLDVSMTDASTAYLQAALAPHIAGGKAPPRRGDDTLTGAQACYGIYETADGGFLSVAPLEPKFWLALCQALGRPDLSKKQFAGATTRAELATIFKSKTRAEWQAVFDHSDACVHPVLRPEELASHPLHQARGNIIEDRHGLARFKTPVRPRDAPPPAAAPALGEHSHAILSELGLDEAAIAAMIGDGVVAVGG